MENIEDVKKAAEVNTLARIEASKAKAKKDGFKFGHIYNPKDEVEDKPKSSSKKAEKPEVEEPADEPKTDKTSTKS